MPRRIAIAGCVLLSVLLRGIDLVSDPPVDLEDSGGYFADEGFWTHNARNKVLFGTWVTDEWNNRYASPLTHWAGYLAFRVAGVGLAQARLLSVILAGPSCALIGSVPGPAGVIGAALFALDPLLVHFGRLALLEAPVVFLLVGAWALLKGEPGPRRLLAAGVVTGLAVGTKLTVWTFVPASAVALLLVPPRVGRLRGLAWFLLGLVCAALAWVALVGEGMPFFLQYARFYASQQAPWAARLWANLREPVLFSRFRASLPLAVCGFGLATVALAPALRGRLERGLTLGALWFAFGALSLTTLTYDPLRYYMPLMPAFVILLAWGASDAWEGRLGVRPTPEGALLFLLFVGPLAWEVLCGLRPSARYWPRGRIVAVAILAAAAYAGSCGVLGRLLARRMLGRVVAVAMLAWCLGWSVRSYVAWFAHRRQVVFTVSRELGTRLERAVFTGQWAPELCLENRHRAVPVWPGFVNASGDPFRRFGITHGLIWGRHWAQFARWFPDEFARARILDTLWVKDSPVVLCAFEDSGRASLGASGGERDVP